MVAWAAATRECTRASSLSAPLLVAAAAGMSEISRGCELPMLLMTSSSGIIPSCAWDGCCADIDADDRDGPELFGCAWHPD